MAGPFAVDPNSAPDISPINLKGGTSVVVPNVDVVGPLTDLALTGAGAFIQQQKAAATQQLNQELKTVRDALQVSRFPGLEQTFFGAEAQKNPYFQEVMKEFQGIRSAQRQGRLTSEYAVERMEALVSQATARTPAFAEEIRAAARDTLGFDAQNRNMANLLQESPADTTRKQLEAAALKVGLSVDDYVAINRSVFMADQELTQLKLLKERGQYAAGELSKEARLSAGQSYMQVMNIVQQELAAGGIKDPAAIQGLVDQTFAAAKLQLQQNLPGSIDGAAVQRELALLDGMRDDLTKMVDNGSLLKVLQTQNETFVAAAVRDVQNIPKIGRMFAIMPENAVLDVLDQFSKFQNNPKGLELFVQSGSKGSGSMYLSEMLDTAANATDILSGQREPSNQQEANTAAWLATKSLQHGAENGQQASRLVAVLKQAGAEVSVAGLSDPRVVKTLATMKETHGEVINFFSDQTTSLSTQYQLLVNGGNLPKAGATLREGRLPLFQTLSVGAGPNTENVQAMEYNSWARNVNRLMDMGDRYRAAGVMPDTKYQSPAQFVAELTKNRQPAVQATPEIIEWGLDDNGNPVRIKR